jgi:hypothetical protein
MGLDWNPLARPKPGTELEFERIVKTDLDKIGASEREAMMARFHEITEPPYATLGAPRVGFDAAADDWLREQLREQGREAEFAAAAADMRGYYVLDLVPDSPGLPVYTSGGYDGVDRYTFRGKFLDDAQRIIGKQLYERAWDLMTATELAAYGQALLDAGRQFAREHKLEALEQQREAPAEIGSDASGVHIVFSAAQWCLWWSARGHGLEPYW